MLLDFEDTAPDGAAVEGEPTPGAGVGADVGAGVGAAVWVEVLPDTGTVKVKIIPCSQ